MIARLDPPHAQVGQAALMGGISGAIGAGVGYGFGSVGYSGFGKIAGNVTNAGVRSGGSMRAMGLAALMAGAMVVADKIYTGTIDSASDHIAGKASAGDFLTTKPGSGLVEKTSKIYVSAAKNGAGLFRNQIGKAVRPGQAVGWLSETGFISRAANQIPGLNALAIVHDIWGGAVGEAAFTYTNVPTMFGAAAITYGAFGSYTPLAGSLAVQK